MNVQFEQFCKRLPKVELHAHLTGSIRPKALHKIWFNKRVHDPTYPLEDPLTKIPEEGITQIEEFFPIFQKYIYKLVNNVEAVKLATHSVLEDFANDGVIYLELRTMPRDCKETNMRKEDYLEAIFDAIAEFERSKLGQKTGLKTKLLLSIDRAGTYAVAEQTVDLALLYKSRGVVGLDLAGDPHKGDTNAFKPLFAKGKELGLGITVHFAEAAATASDDELNILLGYEPNRLSHVIHVSDVIKHVIQRLKYPLELCITCNIHYKMDPRVTEHKDHHFGEWYQEQTNPLIVCTDDVGVFNTTLSKEYYILFRHFGLTKQELYELAAGAANCIFNTQSQKDKLKERFEDWKAGEKDLK